MVTYRGQLLQFPHILEVPGPWCNPHLLRTLQGPLTITLGPERTRAPPDICQPRQCTVRDVRYLCCMLSRSRAFTLCGMMASPAHMLSTWRFPTGPWRVGAISGSTQAYYLSIAIVTLSSNLLTTALQSKITKKNLGKTNRLLSFYYKLSIYIPSFMTIRSDIQVILRLLRQQF
jgi:hypothetical protein